MTVRLGDAPGTGGVGWFATRPLRRGEVAIEETPILLVDTNGTDASLPSGPWQLTRAALLCGHPMHEWVRHPFRRDPEDHLAAAALNAQIDQMLGLDNVLGL